MMRYRLVTPMFNDSHPRVRYAACKCMYVPLSAISRAYPADLSKLYDSGLGDVSRVNADLRVIRLFYLFCV
jgi:hypothetical protein